MVSDTASSEKQIDSFLAKYAPEIASIARVARKKLRKLFPRGYEMVYDNYNALAIGYSPLDRASSAQVSIAAYPRWVTLFFLYGATLSDPDRLLEGGGSRVRSIRLKSAQDLDRAAIKKLIGKAKATVGEQFDSAPQLTTIVKSISKKQRVRRLPVKTKKARRLAKGKKRGGTS